MSPWPQPLEERQKVLDCGVGTLPKVLEAYMGEVAWPNDITFMGIGSTWGDSCLVWFRLL